MNADSFKQKQHTIHINECILLYVVDKMSPFVKKDFVQTENVRSEGAHPLYKL